MTTKQIAEAVGKAEKTVRTWAARVSAKTAEGTAKMADATPNKPADWTLDEALAIIQHGMGKNAADLYRMSAQPQAVAPAMLEGSSLSERDLRIIGGIVAATMAALDARVTKIETRVEERQALLPAPTMDERSQINQLVREYATAAGVSFPSAWGDLYRNYGYRTHTNPALAARNRGMGTLDYLEAEGQLGALIAVAAEIYGGF